MIEIQPRSRIHGDYKPRSLKGMREDALMTQAQVAGALGVSQQAVAKWERDNDPGGAWVRLARLYDVKVDSYLAPFDPAERRVWFDARNAAIQSVPLRGSYGTGKPPGKES